MKSHQIHNTVNFSKPYYITANLGNINPAMFRRDCSGQRSEGRFEDGARSETFTGRLTSLHLVLVAFALSRTLLPARQLKRINVFEAFKGANDTIVTDQTGRLRGMAQSALGAAALTMPEFSTLCNT